MSVNKSLDELRARDKEKGWIRYEIRIPNDSTIKEKIRAYAQRMIKAYEKKK